MGSPKRIYFETLDFTGIIRNKNFLYSIKKNKSLWKNRSICGKECF